MTHDKTKRGRYTVKVVATSACYKLPLDEAANLVFRDLKCRVNWWLLNGTGREDYDATVVIAPLTSESRDDRPYRRVELRSKNMATAAQTLADAFKECILESGC